MYVCMIAEGLPFYSQTSHVTLYMITNYRCDVLDSADFKTTRRTGACLCNMPSPALQSAVSYQPRIKAVCTVVKTLLCTPEKKI